MVILVISKMYNYHEMFKTKYLEIQIVLKPRDRKQINYIYVRNDACLFNRNNIVLVEKIRVSHVG